MSTPTNPPSEDCHCYARARTKKSCPPIKNVTHPLRYYEFTQDELKALEECDRESFYQRCLPFSALFASLTYAAIKMGCLKKNPHFGGVPKILVAAALGHLFGRISSAEMYDRKIRCELPDDSYLGSTMRRYYSDATKKNPKSDCCE